MVGAGKSCSSPTPTLGNERLLNRAGLLGFAVHALVEQALLVEQAGVFDGDGDMAGEGLKNLELVLAESVELGVVDGKDTDDLSIGHQREINSRKRLRLARDVVGIDADVRRIAHNAGGRHVSGHAARTELHARAFAVDTASMHAAEDQIVGARLTQPDAYLYAADRGGEVVDDAVQHVVQLEGGCNELCGSLQVHQRLNELAGVLNAGRKCGNRSLGDAFHRYSLKARTLVISTWRFDEPASCADAAIGWRLEQ